MRQRLCRSKHVDLRPAEKAVLADIEKKFGIIVKGSSIARSRRWSKCGKGMAVKVDPKVVALVDELNRTAGTPEGVALRGKVVRVISAAKRELAGKARKSFHGKW